MGKDKEPLDSATGRVASGIHLVATATIIAAGSTHEEIDLAGLILRRDPARAAPREQAGPIETFNRLCDAAIESANDSAHCGTRAERCALLAADLSRKGIVLIDCDKLAELVDAKIELELIRLGQVVEAPGPMTMLELLGEDPCSNPYCDDFDSCITCGKGNGGAFRRDLGGFGLAVARVDGSGAVEHVPIGEFYEDGGRSAELNPSVND